MLCRPHGNVKVKKIFRSHCGRNILVKYINTISHVYTPLFGATDLIVTSNESFH